MDGIYRCRRMHATPQMRITQKVVTAFAHRGQRNAIPVVTTLFTDHVALRAADFRRLVCVLAVHDVRPSFANRMELAVGTCPLALSGLSQDR